LDIYPVIYHELE